MNRNEKEQVVREVNEALKESRGVFVADFRGLSVEQISKLRSEIRKTGGRFRVVKNTLLTRAVAETDYDSLKEHFSGTTAIVTAPDDAVAAAKALKEFSKEVDKLQIRAGALGEKALSKADVEQLADLPSIDELRGKIVGLLQAPHGQIMRILQAPGEQVARVVKAYSEKESA